MYDSPFSAKFICFMQIILFCLLHVWQLKLFFRPLCSFCCEIHELWIWKSFSAEMSFSWSVHLLFSHTYHLMWRVDSFNKAGSSIQGSNRLSCMPRKHRINYNQKGMTRQGKNNLNFIHKIRLCTSEFT